MELPEPFTTTNIRLKQDYAPKHRKYFDSIIFPSTQIKYEHILRSIYSLINVLLSYQ